MVVALIYFDDVNDFVFTKPEQFFLALTENSVSTCYYRTRDEAINDVDSLDEAYLVEDGKVYHVSVGPHVKAIG